MAIISAQTLANIKKAFWLLLVPGLIASAVFLYYHWSKDWDNPPSLLLENKGQITYGITSIDVTLQCDCPTVLTQSLDRVVSFKVQLDVTLSPASVPTDIIYLLLEPGSADIDFNKLYLVSPEQLFKTRSYTQSFNLKVTPRDTNLSQITFHFFSSKMESLGSVVWPITSRPRFNDMAWPFLASVVVFIALAAAFFWSDRRLRAWRQQAEHRIAEARSQAEANPERVRFAWEVARVKLEAYFDRNLLQVNLVFWVAVLVMAVGFGFVLAGVVLSFRQPKITPTSLVAAISGVITQFIGATFMVIYRSTMAQANEFMVVLDRINSVGMAVQVLDSIPEDKADLKNSTRAQIVELLLSGATRKKPGGSPGQKQPSWEK